MSRISALYQSVTDSIVAELEAGAAPWVKPWTSGGTTSGLMPTNAATGRAYSGINIPILWAAAEAKGFAAHRWMTLRQANGLGAHVRKGERGTEVVFAKQITIGDDATDDDPITIPVLRTYVVFNVAQIEGLAVAQPNKPAATDVEVDAFVAATGARIITGGHQPMYVPSKDLIAMPEAAAFDAVGSYYATLLHELGHWSGHRTRLNRDLSNRFGTEAYAAEELVAELASAFLCAELGIRGELRHAGYIESWIALLRADERAIFIAASKASKAARYLRERSNAEKQLTVHNLVIETAI